MSFILDALKKVDRDRGLRRVPTLGSVHADPLPRRRLWPWLVGGTALLNVAALVVMARMTAPTIPAEPPTAAVAATPAASGSSTRAPAEGPATPERPAPASAPDARGPDPASRVDPPAAGIPAVSRPAAVEAPAAPVAPVPRPALDGGARSQAQALKIEVIVYSENRPERAAWINGQRYTEGERVLGTLVVDEIRPNAVILSGEGRQRLVLEQ